MILRSKKPLKNMSKEEDSCVSSPAESDTEDTIIDMAEPSVSDLKEEILLLRNSLKQLMNASSTPAETTTQKDVITTTANMYSKTAISPPAKATAILKNMPASTAPMQQQKICEYSMPFHYNLPHTFTAARSFAPTLTSMSYSNAQPFVPNPLPFLNAHQYVPTSNSLPYTQSYVPKTTTLPFCTSSVQSQIVPPNMSPHASTVSATVQPSNDSRQLRKLHDLPQFSGQPEGWPMFIVAYRETTLNYHYSNLENLIRLQKCLKGEARNKVESFLIHPDSVHQVISTLEFHYGRPQVLIRSQISKVRAFPSVSERKIHEIVNFSTMVSNLSAFLINANATAHLNNPTLLDELINKLPLQKREEWIKHSVNHLGPYPSIQEFSLWLQEAATYILLSLEADTSKSEVPHNKRDKMNPSFTIVAENNKLTKCPMCRHNHQLYHCDKFRRIPTSERWTFIKSNHLCFSCFTQAIAH